MFSILSFKFHGKVVHLSGHHLRAVTEPFGKLSHSYYTLNILLEGKKEFEILSCFSVPLRNYFCYILKLPLSFREQKKSLLSSC